MPKRLIKKNTGKKEIKTETPKKEVSSVQKVKMLITVIDRSKTLFYLDLLEQFEVNVQMVLYGRGTANSEMINIFSYFTGGFHGGGDKSVVLPISGNTSYTEHPIRASKSSLISKVRFQPFTYPSIIPYLRVTSTKRFSIITKP